MDVDPHQLARRALRPDRARFAEALSIVCGLPAEEALAAWRHTAALRARGVRVAEVWERRPRGLRDPAEVWEALAAREVIPRAWTERSAPGFRVWSTCPACGGVPPRRKRTQPCRQCGGATGAMRDGFAPGTIRACLTLASDPEGVTRAEALAREALARLAPGSAATSATIEWRVLSPYSRVARSGAYRGPLNRLQSEMQRRHVADYRLEPVGEHPRYRAPMVACKAVTDAGGSHDLGGDAFYLVQWEGAANPFEPIVDIWQSGYMLYDVTDDPTLVLIALEIADHQADLPADDARR